MTKPAADPKMDVDTPAAAEPAPAPVDKDALFLADIRANVALLEKAVADLEGRFVTRVLRATPSIRKRVTDTLLARATAAALAPESAIRARVLAILGPAAAAAANEDDRMAIDEPNTASKSPKPAGGPSSLPEVEVYLGLLAIIFLHDQKRYKEGTDLGNQVVSTIQTANRRTLDALAAKVYFYHARFHELTVADGAALTALRPHLLALHRTATLRSDDESAGALLNLVLRSLLAANLVDQADKLVAKAGAFPATASSTQHVRYLYYVGRIAALQLDYSAAHAALQQAIRKAPQGPAALGFVQAATKLSVLVQLLMGEVPDRATFRPPAMRAALEPYRQLVLAVRRGDLAVFTQTVATNAAAFAKDRTQTLVARLRHTVIKTGMRQLSVAYSAISLRDVCLRLGLDSEEDAEYMVARAIRDGVLPSGTKIDHARGVVTSAAAEQAADVYASREPQLAFHSRIQFCLDLHNECVKAMRFPDARKKKGTDAFKSAEEVRELEAEIQAAMEGDDDDF